MSIIKQKKHVISGTLGFVLKILKNPWVTRFPPQTMATNNVTTLKLNILLLEDVVYLLLFRNLFHHDIGMLASQQKIEKDKRFVMCH